MVEWDALSLEQKAGMTKEYWQQLKPEEQKALTDTRCIKEGCSNRRWVEAGSFYCEDHARQESALAIEKAKLETEG